MLGTVIGDVALVLDANDNVATAIEDLSGEQSVTVDESVSKVSSRTIELQDPIEFGHKFALTRINPNDPIYKYGEIIGQATETILPGEWVHTHNCESRRGRGDINDINTEQHTQ